MDSRAPMKLLNISVLLCLCCLLSDCTSATVKQNSGGAPLGASIATVMVTPDAAIGPSDLRWMRENEVPEILNASIRQRLTATGKLNASGATLEVKITDMRLRSTAATVMWGVMAGSDHLRAQVRVIDKGSVRKTFTAEASRTSGAMANPGSGGRTESMCEEMAHELVRQL